MQNNDMILAGRATRRIEKGKRASVLGEPMNEWMNGGKERKKRKKGEKGKKNSSFFLPVGGRVFLFFCIFTPKRREGLEYHRLQGCMFNTGMPSNT